jgi:hypothetical protein
MGLGRFSRLTDAFLVETSTSAFPASEHSHYKPYSMIQPNQGVCAGESLPSQLAGFFFSGPLSPSTILNTSSITNKPTSRH